ncbi:MAG: phenylalanine--tRNA ligase subunit beta, partial [Clostridia bacterium]|nr:phenylalanine--tRNA ligase subunit beta [Clostridia bacterium]
QVKQALVGMGMYEVVTYSFTSPRVYESIGWKVEDKKPDAVTILNPLGEDQSIMRTTLFPQILQVMSHNYNHRLENCSIFEINPIFLPKALPLVDLPDEVLTLAMGEYGENSDFYSLKGKIEKLVSLLGLADRVSFQPGNHSALHPARTAEMLLDGEAIGVFGEVHPKISEGCEIDVRAVLGEINLKILLEQADTNKQYKSLPRYPAVTRDLAFVVGKSVPAAKILDVIRKGGGSILEEVELFDIYEGSQIPEGYKSMAYALSYRASDRTLKDDEVNKAHEKIIGLLESELGASLR